MQNCDNNLVHWGSVLQHYSASVTKKILLYVYVKKVLYGIDILGIVVGHVTELTKCLIRLLATISRGEIPYCETLWSISLKINLSC